MMLLWFTIGLIAIVQSNKFSMKIRSTGSLRAKHIANGQYNKYMELQHGRHRAVANDNGSQPLFDYLDELYIGTVNVGTPGQAVNLVLDTGSSNVWVIDNNCNSSACEGSGVPRHKFDAENSSTFRFDGRNFSIQYGTGSCAGYLGIDVFSFGGLEVKEQGLGVATKIAAFFANQPLDGIFGLGWPALAAQKVVPPMQNVLPWLDEPIFTVWLERKVKQAHGESGGLITYGNFDNENCESNITYVPLSSETYWQFVLDGFSVGSYSRKKKEQAISDTGTSWIGGPRAAISGIIWQIGATYRYLYDFYTVPCTRMHSLPDIVFTIGGVQFNVSSVQYVLDLGIGDGTCAVTFFAMDFAGFMPAWIFGDTWIRSFCNVHNIGEKQIGFAKAIHQF